MSLLFSMSLCGTLLFLFALCIEHLFLNKTGGRYVLRVYKIALAFFLLPFQYFKYNYFDFFNVLDGISMDVSGISFVKRSDKVPVQIGNNEYYYYSKPLLIFLSVSLCIFIICLMYQCLRYHREMQKIKSFSSPMEDAVFEKVITSKDTFVPKRAHNIKIYKNPFIQTPITSGVLHPKIIFPSKELSPREREFLYRHELCHIKNKDVLLKLICILTMMIHWYNPFVYLLYIKIRKLCECACDEMVLEGVSDKDRIFYATLLVNMSVSKEPVKEENMVSKPLFVQRFSSTKKMLKERILIMKNVKKNTKIKKLLTSTAVVMILMSCTMSVLAYESPDSEIISSDVSVDSIVKNEDFFFVPDGVVADPLEYDDITIDYSDSGSVFIGPDNIPHAVISNQITAKSTCSHNYVSGTINRHVKNSSGGCTIKQYNGKRCSKCGATILGSYINSISYVKCPH